MHNSHHTWDFTSSADEGNQIAITIGNGLSPLPDIYYRSRCVFWALMPQKWVGGRGAALDPAGGAYSAPRVAVDMKFPIHIHIHLHRFCVDIHGYIHIHRCLSSIVDISTDWWLPTKHSWFLLSASIEHIYKRKKIKCLHLMKPKNNYVFIKCTQAYMY